MQTPPSAGEAIFQVFDAITFALAYFIGAAVLLANSDPRLVLPLLAWFVLYGFLVRWTLKRVGPASKASADARSMTTGRVVDSYTNIHAVKLFAHHDHEIDYARDAIEETRQTFAAEMRIFTLMDFGLVVLNGLLIVGVVGYAIFLWSTDAATVGIIAAATALTLRLNAMTGWIMWALSSFFRSLGVVQEGMETITDPITLVDAANATPLKLTKGEINLKGATHHYGKETGGLSKVNLTIKPGEKIGLVGRSGAGKSTLVKLLLRFYDLEGGSISIDGQDIRAITQDSLRAHIGMVQQDSTLLHRSVRDNILYGRPDANETDMVEAAKRAEAHDFILDLEDPEGRQGYEAHVGERGVKLSGGQRQRVALARVILKDAPILVLDEATSALDSEVEAAIQDTLYGMMEGKTVIAIAHRLSTIAQMDRIVVLDEGRIIEEREPRSASAVRQALCAILEAAIGRIYWARHGYKRGVVMLKVQGKCLCEQVHVEAFGRPKRVGVCHCKDCKKHHGAPYYAAVIFSKNAVKVTGSTVSFKGRNFCKNCGSSVFALNGEEVEIHLGILEADADYTPQYECWTSRRLKWIEPIAGAAQFKEDRIVN